MNATEQFEAMVNEHYEPLFRFAMSLTRAETDAQDLTQQTFCIWAAKGHQLRDASKAKTWLFTTLHRTFLERRRRERRDSLRSMDEIAEQPPEVAPDFVDQVDAATVLAALARVDEIYRAAVALFYLEEYSYRDIAKILEVPLGTVKSRIARGIAQLRDILLPDESRAAGSREAGISSIPLRRDPAEWSPLSRRCIPRVRGHSGPGHGHWDFGPTLLSEPGI